MAPPEIKRPDSAPPGPPGAAQVLGEVINATVGASEQSKATVKENAIQAAKRKAREFVKNLKSNFINTEKNLKESPLPKSNTTLLEAQETSWGKAVLSGVNIGAVSENQELVDFISRMSTVGEDLQNDPYFLFKEATRLNARTQWVNLSSDAARATEGVLRNIRDTIDNLRGANPVFNKDVDMTLLMTAASPEGRQSMVPRVDPQDELKGRVRDLYDAAVDASDKPDGLHEKVGNILTDIQFIFDAEVPLTSDDLRKRINQLAELRHQDGLDPAEVVRISEDVSEAIKRLRQALRVLETEEKMEHVTSRMGSFIKWGDVKGKVERYDPVKRRMEGLTHNGVPVRRNDNEIFDTGYLSKKDIDLLTSEDGPRRWFYHFIEEIHGLGKEHVQVDIVQTQKYEQFKAYMKWAYGDRATFMIDPYDKLWNDANRLQFVTKGLVYKPGDMKEKMQQVRQFQGADMDYLNKAEHANLATSLMEQVIVETLGERRAKFEDAKRWLTNAPTVDDIVERYNNRMAKEQQEQHINSDRVLTALRKAGITLPKTRAELYKLLRQAHERDSIDLVLQAEMSELQQQLDTVSYGVMLWDDDMQSYTEIGFKMQELILQRDRRAQELRDKGSLPSEDHPDPELKAIEENIRDLREIYGLEREGGMIELEMQKYRGYSKIEIEVHKRLENYLREEYREKLEASGAVVTDKILNNYIQDQEYVLRHAIWSARITTVGTARAMAIAANMAVRPAEDVIGLVGEEYAGKVFRGKAAMRAMFAEDIVRILNPELFHYRFSMGGKMGERALAILQINGLLRQKFGEKGLPKKGKITQTKEWKEMEAHDPEIRQLRAVLEIAENNMGVSFRELLTERPTNTGGYFDGSGWRLEGGMLDEIRNVYLKAARSGQVPEEGSLDNQALSIQLLVAQTPEERYKIFDKMRKRKLSNFFQLLGDDRDKAVNACKSRYHIGDAEWDTKWGKFRSALSLAETKIWHDKVLRFKDIDLAGGGFEAHVKPFLYQAGLADQDINMFHELMQNMQQALVDGGKNSRLTKLSENKISMTLPLTDFDWGDSNFFKMGAAAMDRRGRDMFNQSEAMNHMLQLLSKSEFLTPTTDYRETIKKLKEFRDTMNNYTTANAAEIATKELARVFIEFNRGRSLPFSPSLAHAAMWIPGGMSVMRNMAEWDFHFFRTGWRNKLLNSMTGGAWEHFSEHKLMNWPHSVADAVSYSVRFTGREGNAWGEKRISDVIAAMDDFGLFTENRHFANELRREFHGTISGRYYQLMRRYWWVPIVATIALAALEAYNEEKKSSDGGGGGGHR